MSRGGSMAKRRKEHGLFKAGRTGSHRNAGKGFHRIPISNREKPVDPITVKRTMTIAPNCDRDHPMHLEPGPRHTHFWVCRICEQAIAYKPLRTGLKQPA